MDRYQLQHICKELGMEISINEKVIQEEKGYYENYSLIEYDELSWYYSEMNFEKRPLPEKEDIKKFIDEKDAIKYFFLKILRKFYFKKNHTPHNPINNTHSIDDIKGYFQSLGIEDDCYSFSVIKPQEVYAEIVDDKIMVSYIDTKKQKRFTTLPLDIERGIFVIYRLTYSLHLLKIIERKYIQSNILTERFTDNDIELFIK
ncbi:hypothetical protein RE628_06215 [Paenibacillus sp. D2_2]|uniref:hypothetical protein n=1 Tax=Paenibacillus sp. D2_2 TaxID=3073092 RepID=UPI002815F4FF|nr:hypothetical protein [Paenibacillus sp. D2_2]WMT42027.1 hypothetical protein RE628_06215 [Paenibacillus sp. D2_2]